MEQQVLSCIVSKNLFLRHEEILLMDQLNLNSNQKRNASYFMVLIKIFSSNNFLNYFYIYLLTLLNDQMKLKNLFCHVQ